ncbi:nickel import ATP-binding protein NikE [Phytohalomonas tamaricis]|uniref:nickel import ATP-binding protein NikE n=1 Tax=Phytohalomonas tamaricis TaxID=2081032 RepID=UPI000D0B3A6E|nr:nickel import ATP-binding protein NikE [Phytohalomonas tamaricis]
MTLLIADDVTQRYANSSFDGALGGAVLRSVTLALEPGESVALVGASGAGKSTLGRVLLGLEAPSSGSVRFRDNDIAALRGADYRAYRRAVQVVFQDSMSAVNPRHDVARIIAEPLRHLSTLAKAARRQRINTLLAQVGLGPEVANKLPGQLSGGQLQRVCIARALAVEPALLVLDEAVSNLDLVMQIQILELLAGLRQRLNMAMLFITHDLRLIRRLCERVVVMHEGEIVEDCPAATLRFNHPAARRLQEAILPARPNALGEGNRVSRG